jgi:hypothetical protein
LLSAGWSGESDKLTMRKLFSNSVKRGILIAFILLLSAVSCTMPGIGSPATNLTAEAMTATVGMIVTRLTQAAVTATPIILIPTQTVSPTASPLPTETPTVLPSSTQTQLPCNQAAFVSDVTVPDGSEFYPGEEFTKVWRLRNVGSCTWTTAYSVVFVDGDRMDAPAAVTLPGNVEPQQAVDISIGMVAPNELGTFRGDWMLRNAEGREFGLGYSTPFYVEIKVVAPEAPMVLYDFTSNACSAEWTSTATTPETLACPGNTGDDSGYVVSMDNPQLSDGSFAGFHSLLTSPTWESNPAWNPDQSGGWIEGVYPPFLIQSGAHFEVKLACLYEADSCDVNFTLRIRSIDGDWEELGSWHQTYETDPRLIDLDLAEFAGKEISFMLRVDANGNGGLDQALWIYPRVEK